MDPTVGRIVHVTREDGSGCWPAIVTAKGSSLVDLYVMRMPFEANHGLSNVRAGGSPVEWHDPRGCPL